MMTDTFKKGWRKLSPDNEKLVLKMKLHAEFLETLLSEFQSREMSLALTNLEQCIMWATKAVVLHDEKNFS